MKLSKKYYSYRLDLDSSKKIGGILKKKQGTPLHKLKDTEKLTTQDGGIVFYNADLDESSSLPEKYQNYQFIAISAYQNRTAEAVEGGAADGIHLSDLSESTVLKSLIIADRWRQSQQKLNAATHRLDLLPAHNQGAMVVLNESDKIVYSSSAVESLLGINAGKLLGTDVSSLVHEKERDELRRLLSAQRSTDAKKQVTFKCRIETPSENFAWVEATFTAYSNLRDVSGVVVHFKNMEGKFKNKQPLLLNEFQYQMLVESTSDGVWHRDLEDGEISWSASLYAFLGYAPGEDFKPVSICDLAHPEDRNRAKERIDKRVRSGQEFDAEFRVRKKNDAYVWIRTEGRGFSSANGAMAAALGTVKDIDERKRAELDLELNNIQIVNLTNGINGILAKHRYYPDGRFDNVYVSTGLMSNSTADSNKSDVDPTSFLSQLCPEELEKLRTAFNKSALDNTKVDHVYAVGNPESEQLWYRVVAVPTRFENGMVEWDSITTDVTALRIAEQASLDQEKILENIINSIDGVVQRYKVYPDGRDELVYMSQGFEKISGIPVREVMENRDVVWDQIVEEDRVNVANSIKESREKMTPWRHTWRIIARNGTLKWIQGSGTPTLLNDGSVVFDTVTTEVTRIKGITDELASSKEEFKLATKAAQLGLWKFDPQSNLLEWDDQMFTIYGVDPKSFAGSRQEWTGALHPKDLEKSIRSLNDVITNKAELDFQFRIIKKDTQEVRHIRASAICQENRRGSGLYVIGLNWDVTHIIEAQEKIAESNNRYALASIASQDAIWDLNLNTGVLHWNLSFSKLFGHEIDDQKDQFKEWSQWVHPEDQDRVVRGLEKFFVSGGNKWEERYRFEKGNGDYAYVVDRGFIVRDSTGKATRMVGSMRDVSANTKYLNAIKSQNEQLKKIAWTQSHEIRGPLTRVMGLIDLVERDGFADISITEFLLYLKTAATELDEVIKEIIDSTEEVGIYDPDDKSQS